MRKLMNSFVFAGIAAAWLPLHGLAADPAAKDAVPAKPSNAAPAKPTATDDLFGDPVVAKAKGIEIKRSQLDDEVIRLKGQMAARGRTPSPDESLMIERQVLDQIIQIDLLQAKATEAEKTAGKELAEKKLQEARTQLGSDEAFNRRLKAEGLTREQLLSKWSDAAAAESAVKRELKVDVSQDDAKKYYDDNPSKFEAPEMVRVSHILFSIQDTNDTNPDPVKKKELPEDQKKAKKKQAEDVLKRAKDGEDFTKLAKEYSDDPAVKQNNGEYKFSRDDSFVPEFKAAAFSLNTNQISDLVTTLFGYHILKLWEKLPAKKETFTGPDTKTIYRKPDGDNITIRDILADEGMRKQFPDYMKKLKKESGLEILDSKLKPDETADAGSPPPRK